MTNNDISENIFNLLPQVGTLPMNKIVSVKSHQQNSFINNVGGEKKVAKDGNKFICDGCGRSYYTLLTLQNHYKANHGTKVSRCCELI